MCKNCANSGTIPSKDGFKPCPSCTKKKGTIQEAIDEGRALLQEAKQRISYLGQDLRSRIKRVDCVLGTMIGVVLGTLVGSVIALYQAFVLSSFKALILGWYCFGYLGAVVGAVVGTILASLFIEAVLYFRGDKKHDAEN